jgi:PAS domain S-box-containing protein
MAKSSLVKLVEASESIQYAYFLAERDGNMVFLVDSLPVDFPEFAPSGMIFEDAAEVHWEAFRTGKTLLTDTITNRWRSWISALVPHKDPNDDSVIAVFAIDYSASEWYRRLWGHMVPDSVIVLCVLILSLSLLFGWSRHTRLKSLARQIAYDKALYRSIFEQAPIGIAIVSNQGHENQMKLGSASINPMYEKILGRSKEELQSLTWPELTHPDDLQADLDKFEKFRKGEIKSYSMEKRFLLPDGSAVWTNMTISPFLGAPYKDIMHLCLLEDISMRKQAEAALSESERSKSVLLSHIPGMAYRCKNDKDWTMLYVSAGCLELTGYHPESLLHNRDISFEDVITPEYRPLLRKEWENILGKRLPFKYEYEITTADGKRKWVLEMGQGVFDEEGNVEALEGIILDISDRKAMENNLRYMNEHDAWTGLHNRRYLEKILENDLNVTDSGKRALISVNMSTIQTLTTIYGFHYTRDLIKQIAESLNAHCSDRHSLFSSFENRFVFYVKDYKDKEELIDFCNSVIYTLESILTAERIGGGFGVLEITEETGRNISEILDDILVASERAVELKDKDFGICFYDAELEKQIIREQEIKRELTQIASGDEDGGLFLQYQPILDVKSNRICSFEALARLKSHSLGMVSPLEFIPIAEKTKLIIPIGEKVLHQALDFLKCLTAQGHDDISVSVNVSVVQLLHKDFCHNLFRIIREKKVPPKNIGIEITESVFSSDYEEINRILGELKQMGIHIAIDDFGTGYSSLARERELNVNSLKIDKYFIDALLTIKPEKAITGDIISIAHKFDQDSIAEGVEHEAQKQFLINVGCDKIQGYLISRPLDEDAAIAFIKDYEKTN